MNITLTGASGFLGRRLMARLLADGHHLHVAGRTVPGGLPSGVAFSPWPSAGSPFPPDAIEAASAIVHLAGEPVAQRWNEEAKKRIRSSRVDSTGQIVNAIEASGRRPEVLVCASASGFYGDRGDELLTENSRPGDGFLAGICVEWENAGEAATRLGVRVVSIRTGIVLGTGGGALQKMLPPFRLGAGGRLGSGKQWMPWVHLDDIVELFYFALSNRAVSGPLNGAAPEPVRNQDFTQELALALHRPAIFPVPKIALSILYGEMAGLLTASTRVIPEAAEAAGFRFRYSSLRHALESILA
jgi:uncharacterized protein (TIGR01777 family)